MALKKDGELLMWHYCEVCEENQEIEVWVVDEGDGLIGIDGLHLHFGRNNSDIVKLPPLYIEIPDHNIASRFKHKMELIARAMREHAGEDPEEDDD